MLIDFTFSNFRSFRDESDFSMIAGRVQSMKESLISVPHQRYMKLLALSAIYGANASGKSNFVKALQQLQGIVLTGKAMTVPFLFSPESIKSPTHFDITLLAGEQMYEYVIDICAGATVLETLTQIIGKQEKVIFKRDSAGTRIGEKFLSELSEKDRTFLEMLAERFDSPNLFFSYALQSSVASLQKHLLAVYEWFNDTLTFIEPNSFCTALGPSIFFHREEYAEALRKLDTGISNIDITPTFVDDSLLPKEVVETLNKSPNQSLVTNGIDPLILRKEGEDIKAYRYAGRHKVNGHLPVCLPFSEESDGTRRLLHLLPTIIEKGNQPKVFIVDELDRSLHTELTRHLIETHRRYSNQQPPKQLIFTTHDVALMDLDLFRRDEIWVADKHPKEQSSVLIAFDDYKDIRTDNNIRKSYLTGRMGGVPYLTTLQQVNDTQTERTTSNLP